MAYNPSLPANGAPVVSAELRDQFNGLKTLIDAIPGITSAVVDSVTTLGPGESATVTLSITGTVLHISLAIPRGIDGTPGPEGQQGQQGPAFSNVTIDSVGTLNPGDSATVSVSFDGSTVHFSFGIPRGAQGEQGIPGPASEVTNATMTGAIASAIEGTANNTNGVATLDTPFADPDSETLRVKVNELILAQRR